MSRGPADVLDEVRAALDSPFKVPLSNLSLEFDLKVDLCASFPDDVFKRYTSLSTEPLFRKHDDAWHFVRQVEDSWELLSASQREQLRPLLIESFDQWSNSTGAFVIGELLGRRYGDLNALETLVRLGREASMPARGLVPHGLETLARRTDDTGLRRRAVLALRELEQDRDEVVREEACLALAKVARHTGVS